MYMYGGRSREKVSNGVYTTIHVYRTPVRRKNNALVGRLLEYKLADQLHVVVIDHGREYWVFVVASDICVVQWTGCDTELWSVSQLGDNLALCSAYELPN